MNILFFGDVVGKIGREAIARVLPELKKKLKIHLTIANVENLAHGEGVTLKTLNELSNFGVDFFTSGNHIWARKEVFQIFQENKIPLIRPANYPHFVPGTGFKTVLVDSQKVLIINLQSRVFMKENLDCPFRKIDEILKNFEKEKIITLVDFHSEASSEKRAFGLYLDGRVSAVLGTHTHLPTADAQILEKGTGYISDIGMVGLKDSVLGVKKEIIIAQFLEQIPKAFEYQERGLAIVNSVFLEIDPKTKKCVKIKRIDREIEI